MREGSRSEHRRRTGRARAAQLGHPGACGSTKCALVTAKVRSFEHKSARNLPPLIRLGPRAIPPLGASADTSPLCHVRVALAVIPTWGSAAYAPCYALASCSSAQFRAAGALPSCSLTSTRRSSLPDSAVAPTSHTPSCRPTVSLCRAASPARQRIVRAWAASSASPRQEAHLGRRLGSLDL